MKQKSKNLDVQAIAMFLIGGGLSARAEERLLGRQAGGVQRHGDGWLRLVRREGSGLAGCAGRSECGVAAGVKGTVHGMLDGWGGRRGGRVAEAPGDAVQGARGRDRDGAGCVRWAISDRGGSHSCRRRLVIQKYCATGEDVGKQCQWLNVMLPLKRITTGQEEGAQILRQRRYRKELGRDWREYVRLPGKRHQARVWGVF